MTADQQNAFSIRRATIGDIGALVDFNCGIARETESRELDRQIVARGVEGGLSHGDEIQYYMAEVDSKPVGCLMLTREWSDWRDGWYWWIQSVFVQPEQRASGAFRTLYRSVIERARAQGSVRAVRLYVDADNRAAQVVYGALGMAPSSYRMFEFELESGGPGSASQPSGCGP